MKRTILVAIRNHLQYQLKRFAGHCTGTLVLTAFAICSTGVSAAQEIQRTMSLKELFALADSESKTIRLFQAAVRGAEQDISLAKNAILPDITLSASASYNGNAWVSERDFSNGQNFSSPHFGNNFALEASQTVFAGGRIANEIKAKEVGKKIAEWNLAEHKQDIYFLLTGYYLDLFKYRNLLGVYDSNMEQTMQLINEMRAREKAGIALENDITRYEVQYKNLEYKRTELLSSIRISNDRIVTMLDLPPGTEIYPDTALLHKTMPKPGETEFLEMASIHSPVLNRDRLNIDLLSRKEKAAKAGFLPNISIVAGDNLKGPITYEIPVLNNNINTWYVGIGLNFSIGNLYKTPKEVSRIRTGITQAELQLASSEEETMHNVRAAYIHYIDSFELLRTQEKSLELATENYEVISNRYSNDLVLVTDLVDADNLKLTAEIQTVNARINIIYNYYRLLYATGMLNCE